MRNSILMLVLIICMSYTQTSLAQPTKLTDENTQFHRLYVLGCGQNSSEDSAFQDDLSELKADLEQNDNQANDSTSETLVTPSRNRLQNELNDLKNTADAGDEVTFYFSGHGGGGAGSGVPDSSGEEDFDEHIWLSCGADGMPNTNDDVFVTDDELADMLEGFRDGVTLVILMDSCFGGGFTGGSDDIQESNTVTVIGPSTTCPIDPTGIFGAFTETLAEAMADGAGEGEANDDDDSSVTAEELESWLEDEGWEIGEPDDSETSDKKVKKGNSKCIRPDGERCGIPLVESDDTTVFSGDELRLIGRYFDSNTPVDVYVLDPSFQIVIEGAAFTDSEGHFSIDLLVSAPPGSYQILIKDESENQFWLLIEVVP